MTDDRQDMLAFLGVAPDPRLLDDDMGNLPGTEQHESRRCPPGDMGGSSLPDPRSPA